MRDRDLGADLYEASLRNRHRGLNLAVTLLVALVALAYLDHHARIVHARLLAAVVPTVPLAAPPLQPAELTSELARDLVERLAPLHRRPGPILPGDWLFDHRERGQSFAEYVARRPRVASRERHVIYLQPIGAFAPEEAAIAELVNDYVKRFYGLPTRVLPTLPVDETWPAGSTRRQPDGEQRQLNASYILYGLLWPSLPDDAVMLLGYTAQDLWPGPEWNFVFGYASVYRRVGVWSLYRHGDPDNEFYAVLERAVRTAVHEAGHTLSMRHCTAYECVMAGANGRDEIDRQPLDLCPVCLAKLVHATGVDPLTRYERLAAFCRTHGFDRPLEALQQAAALLHRSPAALARRENLAARR